MNLSALGHRVPGIAAVIPVSPPQDTNAIFWKKNKGWAIGNLGPMGHSLGRQKDKLGISWLVPSLLRVPMENWQGGPRPWRSQQDTDGITVWGTSVSERLPSVTIGNTWERKSLRNRMSRAGVPSPLSNLNPHCSNRTSSQKSCGLVSQAKVLRVRGWMP